MKDLQYFKGKSICITGATSGIGLELAKALSQVDCTLHLSSRDITRVEELVLLLNGKSAQIKAFALDQGDERSVNQAAQHILASAAQLDMLFLNAGISQRATALDTQPSVVKHIMQVDFLGMVDFESQLRPKLLQSEAPHIIVTSSVAGLFGYPLRSSYSAAKHAAQGYYESMQLETERPAITIVSPGRADTAIAKSAMRGDGKATGLNDQELQAGLKASYVARRILKATSRQKKSLIIARAEWILIILHRYCPPLFRFVVKRINAS